jgi:hypothetical protein
MDRDDWDRRIKQIGAPVLTVLATAAVVLLAWIAGDAAASSSKFSVRPDRVAVLQRPAWMGAETARAIAAELSGGLPGPVSLSDSGALAAWHTRLDRISPWVEVVLGLSPSFPGRAEARLRLRRPVLSLPNGEWVSADGSVLGQGQVQLEPAPLRLIGPMGLDEIAECAQGAAEIAPWRAKLAEQALELVTVRLSAEQRVVFTTTDGVAIEWGRPARQSEFAAVDLPAATRIANLLEVAEGRPGLIGVERVVLWLDRPEVHPIP